MKICESVVFCNAENDARATTSRTTRLSTVAVSRVAALRVIRRDRPNDALSTLKMQPLCPLSTRGGRCLKTPQTFRSFPAEKTKRVFEDVISPSLEH